MDIKVMVNCGADVDAVGDLGKYAFASSGTNR